MNHTSAVRSRTRRMATTMVVACAALGACADDAAPRDLSTDADAQADLDVAPDAAEPDAGDADAVDAPIDAAPDAESLTPGALGLARFCDDRGAEVDARIDDLLANLTLAQKVGLMHGDVTRAANNLWMHPGVPELGIPDLVMVDGPRGVNHRIEGLGATAFPVGAMRGATWNVDLERRVGEAMAREARAVGAGVLLAPTVNILRHPRWGRAQETYGEDPFHMGELGAAFVEGVQSRDVVACAKHFAANSIEDTRFEVDVQVDERALREVYLPHFRRLVEAGVGSVMSAYNSVNGAFCGENEPLLRDILKNEWGFAGFVVSDWIFGTHSTAPSALAGLDVEMPGEQYYGPALVRAVEAGDVPELLIDDAVRRILRVRFCFEHDTRPPENDRVGLESAAARELAREVARRGIVLLRNEDSALPLGDDVLRVVVAGRVADLENIGDEGSSAVRPRDVVTALEGIRAALPGARVDHIAGTTLDGSGEALVDAADAVIVVTGNVAADEGESFIAAGDRDSLALPSDENALIEALAARSARVVVVLEGGSAIEMPWVADVEAVLMAWYPGVEGGTAIGEVLAGTIAPMGRLPVSFPRAEADLPPFDNVSLQVTYDRWHGYQHLERAGTAPLFAFGHGLTYTSFAYETVEARPSADDGNWLVDVTLRNAGDRAGVETVQIYATRPAESPDAPERELVGFAQVPLEPGATETVTVTIARDSLGRWGGAGMVVDPGVWTLRAAPNAVEDGVATTIEVVP